MPGTDDQEPASRGLPVALRLLGTVVSPGGEGFAMCQLGQEPPKLVRPGARIGALTLRSVAQGRALFLSPEGDEFEVRVSNNND